MKAILALLAAVLSIPSAFGLAEESIGPDSSRGHPTTEQQGWPKGIVELFRHNSRAYSMWVNGGESVYFKTSPDELQELVNLFAQSRMRDHQLVLKGEVPTVTTFGKESIDYNVHLRTLNGIALHYSRKKGGADTFEPILTIHVPTEQAATFLTNLVIPDHVILDNQIDANTLKTPAVKPSRSLWQTKIRFPDKSPAVDFESGVHTTLTYWVEDSESGIEVGAVDHEGTFKAAFSDQEIADLKAAKSWLTITTGNYLTKASREHPRLPVESLSKHPNAAEVFIIARPGLRYGRLLFDDGSPAFLDSPPWPGAEIMISFPFAGAVNPDKLGYFELFFTPEQLAELAKKKDRANVYIPLHKNGTSRALHIFPVDLLSPDKQSAGVLKIPKSTPAE